MFLNYGPILNGFILGVEILALLSILATLVQVSQSNIFFEILLKYGAVTLVYFTLCMGLYLGFNTAKTGKIVSIETCKFVFTLFYVLWFGISVPILREITKDL